MSFVFTGVSPQTFSHFFGLPDDVLRLQNTVRKTADSKPDETTLLLNQERDSAPMPYASRYAIYVRENEVAASTVCDELPPVFRNRPIALRLFSAEGMLMGADMGMNVELKATLDAAFARPDVAFIPARNASYGCFAAEVRRGT